MNVRASAKMVGTSSRKISLVAALIRGRKAQEAATLLTQTPKRASGPVNKVLQSAIANAENNYNLHARDLVVEAVTVGPGPTLKRFRPRVQGKATQILKRTSHITVVLGDRKAAEAAEAAAKTQPTDATQPAQTKQTLPKEAK